MDASEQTVAGEPVALVSRALHLLVALADQKFSIAAVSRTKTHLYRIGALEATQRTSLPADSESRPSTPQCAARTSSPCPVQSECCGSAVELGTSRHFSTHVPDYCNARVDVSAVEETYCSPILRGKLQVEVLANPFTMAGHPLSRGSSSNMSQSRHVEIPVAHQQPDEGGLPVPG